MNNKPKPNRSFFSIAAWYAVVAPLAAAAISSIGWFIFFHSDQGDSWSMFFDSSVAFAFVTADFVLLTSAAASIVCLFGLRRHGWRVIVWKSMAGFTLSLLVFAAPSIYFWFHPLIIQVAHTQNQEAMRFDTQDLTMTADAAVQSLLNSSVFDRAPHHPAMLEIGRFVNITTRQLDLDLTLLSSHISAALVKTGKAVVVEKQQNATDKASGSDALSHPDFYLSGKVIESKERTGILKQPTYLLALSLVDSNGLAVWEEEKTITAPHSAIPASDNGKH